jgi:2-oxoisovalerate dehydrogenase E1 component
VPSPSSAEVGPREVELAGPGAGEELVAHLAGVLAGLEAHAAGREARNGADHLGQRRDPLGGDHVDHGQYGGHAGHAWRPAERGADPAHAELVPLFEAQAASRWLDVAARRMRALGEGFYTIGSAGHEANAAVALATRPTDPALLHYRSGGFYLARSTQAGRPPGAGLLDVALGLAASADDPASGGRHKVFGHPDLAVIPQTSTIASHLPRALGVGWALGRQDRIPARLRSPLRWQDDSIVVASFGDASANHSTATGAVNAACWSARQGIAMPLLLVCEDNGIGISVATPPGWIAAMFAGRSGLEYRRDDGRDPLATLATARDAAAHAREHRMPVLLHLSCVRIGGHAGSDVESAYRSAADVAADLERDPLAATMRALVAHGVFTPGQVRLRWERVRDGVAEAVREAVHRPKLVTAEQVMAALAPRTPSEVARRAAATAPGDERRRAHGGRLPEVEGPLTLAQSINRALADAAAADPNVVLLGEDVGRKGGVYGVTRGLQRRLGASRVVDTLLDEQTVLGLALGAGVSGLLPVPEIQYLAYLHNAEDQLRGEAATLQFFSRGAYRNPLVVRVQGLGYQRGFGGHFHNDNGLAVLRDIPGLVVACPAHPREAPALLRTCLAAAAVDGTVSVVVEPIALYHERDLVRPGDGGWLAPYEPPEAWPAAHAPIGRAATWGSGGDLTIATFGNGLRMSLRVAARLRGEGVGVRVVDLRWLAPLPVEDVVREARATGRLLVVDETRATGGVSEGLVTGLLEAGYAGRLARIAADDSLVPLGAAAPLVLVSEADVEDAARLLLAR